MRFRKKPILSDWYRSVTISKLTAIAQENTRKFGRLLYYLVDERDWFKFFQNFKFSFRADVPLFPYKAKRISRYCFSFQIKALYFRALFFSRSSSSTSHYIISSHSILLSKWSTSHYVTISHFDKSLFPSPFPKSSSVQSSCPYPFCCCRFCSRCRWSSCRRGWRKCIFVVKIKGWPVDLNSSRKRIHKTVAYQEHLQTPPSRGARGHSVKPLARNSARGWNIQQLSSERNPARIVQ